MNRRGASRGRVRRWLRDRAGLAALLGLPARDREVLAWQAHRRLARGATGDAEPLYRAILALWPDSAEAATGLGACLQSRGDLAGAEACYSDAIALDPASPFALVDRAEVRLLLGRPLDAGRDLDLAAALPPRLLRRSGLVPRIADLKAIARDRSAGAVVESEG